MPEIVPAGPYFGFTLAQLETELASLIARRQAISAQIGASINGNSFQREGTGAELRSLDQQVRDLQDALAFLDPSKYEPAGSNRAVITFRA
jgi:hypothetical protein